MSPSSASRPVPLPPAVLGALQEVVGGSHVLTEADGTVGYAVDWTGRFHGATPAVVRPADAAETARVLAVCNDARIAVVPQGGNTGLVGGSVPLHGEIVLSLRRLRGIGPVDAHGYVTAAAGVTIAEVQAAARAAGWEYGVDLGARDVATVGGTIATNAGGLRVLRYGSTRRQVLGVQAALADGRVVDRLDALEKDNTGYDLTGLCCGSEGTLAVVTAARLRLVPRPRHAATALLAFDGIPAALAAVGVLRRELDAVSAIELFLQDGLDLVCDRLGLPAPLPSRHVAYVLVEATGHADPTDALALAVDGCDDVRATAVAVDEPSSRSLWRYREAHTEVINLLGPPHKLDVTLPFEHLASFAQQVRATVADVAPAASVWLFGHAGDGNVHVNVTGVEPDDEGVTDAVLRLVVALHGSISAEHGVGTAKRRWLSLVRSDTERSLFRALKDAFDPNGILNPHVLLDPRS